jgi:hypothetical protein
MKGQEKRFPLPEKQLEKTSRKAVKKSNTPINGHEFDMQRRAPILPEKTE